MTRPEALTLVTMLVGAYPRELKDETVETYAQFLLDLDQAQTLEAIRRLVSTSKFLPSIAEIRGAVANATAAPILGNSTEAWTEALGLIRRIGAYGELGSRGTPAVNRTLRLLGSWDDVCADDPTFLRQRFVALYERVAQDTTEALACGEPVHWLEDLRPVKQLDDYRAALKGLAAELAQVPDDPDSAL